MRAAAKVVVEPGAERILASQFNKLLVTSLRPGESLISGGIPPKLPHSLSSF